MSYGQKIMMGTPSTPITAKNVEWTKKIVMLTPSTHITETKCCTNKKWWCEHLSSPTAAKNVGWTKKWWCEHIQPPLLQKMLNEKKNDDANTFNPHYCKKCRTDKKVIVWTHYAPIVEKNVGQSVWHFSWNLVFMYIFTVKYYEFVFYYEKWGCSIKYVFPLCMHSGNSVICGLLRFIFILVWCIEFHKAGRYQ